MDAQRIGANAFLLIGLGALAGAAALGRGAVNFDRRARHVRGTVVEVFPQNGQPVEYGERLFSIRPR